MTVPLRAGGYVLGVRANTEDIGACLEQLFADRYVPDAQPPSNLSLLLAPPSEHGDPQELHRLYVTYTRALRTRSATRALEALWHELDLRDVEVARQRLQLDAAVLVRDGGAIVLPASAGRRLVDDERRWRRAGLQRVDRRRVDLDPIEGTITVPTPRFAGDPGALDAAMGELTVAHREDDPGPAGTYPITAWALPPGQPSLAARVIQAAGQVVDRPAHGGVALVEGLAVLLARVAELSWTTSDALLEQLS